MRPLSCLGPTIAAAMVFGSPGAASAQVPENLVVQVEPAPEGGARVRGSIDIPAPPAVVWKVMLDCSHALQYVPKLVDCRVLKTDPGGASDVREHVFNYGVLGRIRHVFRSDYVPRSRIRTVRVDGDLRSSQGEWRLQPLNGGSATRVSYESRSQPKTPVPGPIARQAVRRDAPASLRGLRRHSIEAARTSSRGS